MRKFILGTFIFLVFLSAGSMLAAPVFAHTIKVDGTIQAMLHIDPADSPQATIPSRIEFQVTSLTPPSFTFQNCNCMLTITQNNTVLLSKNILDPSIDKSQNSLGLTYVFPTAGTYTLTLAGTSTGQIFKPFTLRYPVSVNKPGAHSWLLSFLTVHSFHIILFALAIVVGVILTIVEVISERKALKNSGK